MGAALSQPELLDHPRQESQTAQRRETAKLQQRRDMDSRVLRKVSFRASFLQRPQAHLFIIREADSDLSLEVLLLGGGGLRRQDSETEATYEAVNKVRPRDC
jgi:hypothetical protein